MIVQCEHCKTKYRIADEKVKGKGVKVRCAKCENVFTVAPPENDIQDQSAAQPSPPPIEETGPSHTKGELEESPGLPPLPPLGGSQDSPLPPEQGQPPVDTPVDDQASDSLGQSSLDGGSIDSVAQRPAHEMDTTGLASPPMEASDQPEDGGFEIESTIHEEPSPEPDHFGSEADEGLAPLTQEPDPDAEWGNIAIDAQAAPDGGDDIGLAGSSGYTPPPPVPIEETIEEEPAYHLDDDDPGTSSVPAYQPETRSSSGGKKGLVILLLLAALGGGGYFAYPKVMEIIQSRGQQTKGTLTPDKVRVKALTRIDGKIVYSVRGVVLNGSEGNVGMIQIEAQFRNVAGDVLSKATSYCGNLFEENELVNLDLNRIQSDLQNELGQSLSNANIPPGQAVPFLVILDNPPPGISKVTVTISSFKETT